MNFSPNIDALAFLGGISIGTGILFGLAPALKLANVDINGAVKDGSQSASAGSRGRRLANLLVVFEMVLCVVLVSGAGLLIRSTVKVYNSPLGVNPANVLTMHINLPESKYPLPQDRIAFHDQLMAQINSLPGVESAAIASALPSWWLGVMNFPCEIEGTSQAAIAASAIVRQPRLFSRHAGASGSGPFIR